MIALLVAGTCLSGLPLAQSASKIAFVSDRDGNEEIYTMYADGTGVRRLTNNKARDVQPSWSSDGAKLTWSTNRTGDWEIFVMNADGTEVYNLTETKERDDTSPMWSSLHDLVRFVSKKRFYTSDPDGDRPRQLTDYAIRTDCQPALSNDGLRVAFRNPTGALMIMDGWHTTKQVRMPLGSDGLPKQVANPAWGHDGAIIAFDSGEALPTLYSVDLESTIVEKVMFRGNGFDPVFLNESDTLVFTNPLGVGKGSDVFLIDLDAIHRSQGLPEPVNLTKMAGNDSQAAVWQSKSEGA